MNNMTALNSLMELILPRAIYFLIVLDIFCAIKSNFGCFKGVKINGGTKRVYHITLLLVSG